jgi:hypothetical protein
MKKKDVFFFGIALAVSAAMLTLGSCDNGTIPEDPAIPLSVTDDASWKAAIDEIKQNGAGKRYTITLTGDIQVDGKTNDTFGGVSGLTVTIKGSGALSLAPGGSGGHLLQIKKNQTLNIGEPGGNGPTLRGKTGNTRNLVRVNEGGALNMFSGAITGNDTSGKTGDDWAGAGGVTISGGVFTLEGGTISNNKPGSGVFVGSDAVFTMKGGTISGNEAENGGGVSMYSEPDKPAVFTMKGGFITGNKVTIDGQGDGNRRSNGGGIFVSNHCTFTLEGGEISGNSADAANGGNSHGGGVFAGGVFTMTGGAIRANTALSSGGGVMVVNTTQFSKTGGTIYGDTDGTQSGDDNTVIGRTSGSGHAVYYWIESPGTGYYRDTTLAGGGNISSGDTGSGWAQ